LTDIDNLSFEEEERRKLGSVKRILLNQQSRKEISNNNIVTSSPYKYIANNNSNYNSNNHRNQNQSNSVDDLHLLENELEFELDDHSYDSFHFGGGDNSIIITSPQLSPRDIRSRDSRDSRESHSRSISRQGTQSHSNYNSNNRLQRESVIKKQQQQLALQLPQIEYDRLVNFLQPISLSDLAPIFAKEGN
jgi:hypothetical protein